MPKPGGEPPSRVSKPETSPSAPRFKGKFRIASTDPSTFSPVFDLFAAVEDSRSRYDKTDKDLIKSFTLYSLPNYVRANLNRVILNEGVSQEEARWCCIHFGVGRLFADERFKQWNALYELATAKQTHYQNDGDWDDVQDCLERFRFKPNDYYTGARTTNARLPEPIRAQVAGAAKVLGLPASTIATVCFIDALRRLDDVMHGKDMDSTVEDFFNRLERRTQRLRNLLVEVGVIEPRQGR